MNYQRVHDQIIKNAKERLELDGYVEIHHIIPKSMGGSNDSDNLVSLTAKEHFVIHHLLSKIHGKSMAQAFGMMCLANTSKYNKRQYNVSSRLYEAAKEALSAARTGKNMPDHVRQKIRESMLGVAKSEETKKKMRKPKSEEHANNIRLARIGNKNPMFGKPSPARGIPHTEETRKRISERTKESTEMPPCPHCGKVTNRGNALRWHYDNCKHKGN